MKRPTQEISISERLKYKQILAFFESVPFFEPINPEEIKVIAKHIATRKLKEGEILFNESEKGNFLCLIIHGCLEVSVQLKEKKTVIATLTRGQSIGEMAIIEDQPRFATVTAIEESQLYLLSKSAFDLILSRNPYTGIKLLKGISRVLSNNLRQTSLQLSQFIESESILP